MKTKEVEFDNGAVAYFYDNDKLDSTRLAPDVPCASSKAGTGKVEHFLVRPVDRGQAQARKILALLDAGATHQEVFEQTGFGGVGSEIEAFRLDGTGLKDAPEAYAIEALGCLGEGSSMYPTAGPRAMIEDYRKLYSEMSKAYESEFVLTGTPIVGNPKDMKVNCSGPYGVYVSRMMDWLIRNYIDLKREPSTREMHARKHFDQLAQRFGFSDLEEMKDKVPGSIFPFAAGHVSIGIPTLPQDCTVNANIAFCMSDVANSALTRGPLEMMAAESPIIWGQLLPFRDARMALRGISRSTGDGYEIGTYANYKKRILMGLKRGVGNSIGRLAYPSREGDPGLHAGTRLRIESSNPRHNFPTARVEHTGRSSAGPLATLAGNAYLRLVMQEIVLPAVASGQHPSQFWGGTFPTISDHSSQATSNYVSRVEGGLTKRVLRDASGVLELAESNALKRGCRETQGLVELCRAGLGRVYYPKVAPDFESVAKEPAGYNIPDTLHALRQRGANNEEIIGGIDFIQKGELKLVRSRFGS